MEAKDQNMIWMTDEMDFFILIEEKLEEQGYEVLETLAPSRMSSSRLSSDRMGRSTLKSIFTDRSSNRFAY